MYCQQIKKKSLPDRLVFSVGLGEDNLPPPSSRDGMGESEEKDELVICIMHSFDD